MAATVEESTPPDMATATVLLTLFSTSSSMTGAAGRVPARVGLRGRILGAGYGAILREILQVIAHRREEGCPVSGCGLTEEPRRRVPRAVFAVRMPSPVGEVGEHDPYREAHGAGEVRDGGVDSEDEVEGGHEGCGFCHVLVARAGVDERKWGVPDLGGRRSELQGEKESVGDFGKRR